MTDKVQREEVQKWVELLRSSVATDRLKGAMELASLGVRMRGAVRTRGAISQAASSQLPKGVLSAAFDVFKKDQPVEIRREVAFVLGEWADETAVSILKRIAETDPEAGVRGEAIDALGQIGGLDAVEVLKAAARKDPSDDVRIRAVHALAELAQAEPPDSQAVAEVLQVLETVQTKDPSDPVRAQAAEAVAQLRGRS